MHISALQVKSRSFIDMELSAAFLRLLAKFLILLSCFFLSSILKNIVGELSVHTHEELIVWLRAREKG